MGKELGQVFTPAWVVDLILDAVGFSGEDALRLRVLEPSCGDGAFLEAIAERVVSAAMLAGLPKADTVRLLEAHIVGMELDPPALEAARTRMGAFAGSHGLGHVSWDLRPGDTLAWAKETAERFDRVVGNPPYVRIHNLPEATRELLREKYDMCRQGMTDTYIAFYEAGLGLLAPGGKLGYIAPDSFLYNATAKPFRRMLREGGLIESLTDFGHGQVFPDASTYTAVMVLSADGGLDGFRYSRGDAEGRSAGEDTPVSLADLTDTPWTLPPEEETSGISVGDLARVQYGVATLADRLFISADVRPSETDPEVWIFNGTRVERGMLRPAVKVSTYTPEAEARWALWPYREEGGTAGVIPEEEMRESFPLAYYYFISVRERLLARDLHSPKAFYEYGRSQALSSVGREKLVLSPIMRDRVRAWIVPAGTVPYGGFFATGDRASLERVRKAVEDPRFLAAGMRAGKPMRGGWRSITATTLREYRIPE